MTSIVHVQVKSRKKSWQNLTEKDTVTLRLAVGESVVSVLKPLQEEVERLSKDKAYIDGIIKENAEKANYYAMKTLRKVQKKVGFPERIR